jgi:hypothetical protein
VKERKLSRTEKPNKEIDKIDNQKLLGDIQHKIDNQKPKKKKKIEQNRKTNKYINKSMKLGKANQNQREKNASLRFK